MSAQTTSVRRLLDVLQLRIIRRHPAASRQTLGYRRLFILPTRQGLFFLMLGALIFVLSINYVLSLGLALAFSMFSLFMAAILQTFRNLYGMEVIAGSGSDQPVFAGQEARFAITLQSESGSPATAVSVQFRKRGEADSVSPGHGRSTVRLSLPVTRRGRHRAPPVRLESQYPTGLCRVWSDVDLALDYLVCPEPVTPPDNAGMARKQSASTDSSGMGSLSEGIEYFHDLRKYRSGDSLSRIAWKSLAGRRELQVKQFFDADGADRMLRWDDFPGVAPELRLSWLCHLVLTSAREGGSYGLQLPGRQIPPGQGEDHQRKLLEALALHDTGEPG
ncbi:MAG: DUF58 domain-containing protein [Pseudohongiellaceae bacterium]